ncbi:unnamed protein product [Arctia plantaginis]|uniref:Uncharacterized protein n=1 Tax=Arctia plantaginis TaxID=874455 RepID=A0A8S0ZFZ1_ARCPL|nr:unnamed protein product [Arctia plantaginis]
MTDSESELSNSNLLPFQTVNTTVSARGPYTNISNFSFRNPMTSTMYNMPRNFERQRYAESVSDQRSIYYRRERSPMSIHSACDVWPRNFQQHYGMNSQRSVFNGRSGSPLSIRSNDSSASAADIAFAFKNVKFNKYDLKVIKEAYQKLMKQRHRKRIEKRRNMRKFLKVNRNRSGDDSGEQASDSSVSSDDCRSIKTSYKENVSSSRMTRMDNMLKDCTESFRQNTFKNIFSVGNNFKGNQKFDSSSLSNNIHALPSQKERFKTGFLLPSQRFNKSVVSTFVSQNIESNLNSNESNCKQNEVLMGDKSPVSGSEEEIFPGKTARENIVCNKEVVHKRTLDGDEDSSFPDRKRSKKSSPNIIPKSKTKILSTTKNSTINNNVVDSNNFEFAKPTLPIKKSRTKMQEKILSKSNNPLTEFVESIPKQISRNVEEVQPLISPSKPVNGQPEIVQSASSQDCEVSMRPSFIKRKLFTQKLDVAEKSNVSSEVINSPQDVYNTFQKEKNKARKLVPTQSCMNREVQRDNNLLDLIHKIVPPDSINRSNQTKTDVNNSNKRDDDDTWDVTSVISMCNETDVSDTFTDEDIFGNNDKKKCRSKNTKNTNNLPKTRNSSFIKPKTVKNIIDSVNLPQECRTTIAKVDKEKSKKPNSTNSRPNTRNRSKIESEKPKAIKCIDKNLISSHEGSIVINKVDKDKSKKAYTNPYRITRNNSFLKQKEVKSIDENKNLTQNEEKSKNSNNTNLLRTRIDSNIKPKAAKSEDKKSPLKSRRAPNKIDNELTKKSNESNHRMTRNNSNIKLKEAKHIDESMNQDKEKSKRNNNVNHLPKTRNNSNIKLKETKHIDESMNQDNKKEKSKINNNVNHLPKTGNNSNIKLKETKHIDESMNQNKEESKRNNNVNHLLKTRNNSNIKPKECKVIINEMPATQGALKAGTILKINALYNNTNVTKNIVKRSAKTFWDTDFESDAEYQSTPQRRAIKR